MERITAPTPERSQMSDDDLREIQDALVRDKLVTDTKRFNKLVTGLKTEQPIDATVTVRELEGCSRYLRKLFGADIGLLRPARLGEHTEADLSGLEQDYRQLFPGEPESIQILRFASLAQDSGKSLCTKIEGDSGKQMTYNKIVTNAMLDVVDPEIMADDAKEVVRLLVEFDLIGNPLQGKFDQAKLDELKARWPARFAHRLADFVIVSYMSDASAHTAHRQFTDMVTGEQKPCVTPEDVSLDFLFAPREPGQPLTLQQPYRRVVAALFPGSQATQALVHDPDVEQYPLKREYIHKTEAEGIWSATIDLPPQKYEVVTGQIEAFAMRTGFPISAFLKRGKDDMVSTVTIVRDPSRRFGTPEPREQDMAMVELCSSLGWKRQRDDTPTPDVSTCVGLLEGYDEETGILHAPAEALALLLENSHGVRWRTESTTLLSARRVENDAGEFELQSWDEKVMRIQGSARNGEQSASSNPALDAAKNLASRLNQQRLFLEDGVAGKTITFAA